MPENDVSLTYKDAGVDIASGNALVERIKTVANRTKRPEISGGLGGFGAACEIPPGYRNPVLVSGTDGVGSKLKLATTFNLHGTIGIDLVAMCVNDIIVSGAEPLFFLDYFATGKLDVDTAATVIEGIGKGCEMAGCALAGGETAEMPGMYQGSDYDLAGFCVGVAEKENMIDGSKVKKGDTLIALASSGAHSNGYSLIRKLLDRHDAPENIMIENSSLIQLLMEPTRIYVNSLLRLIKTQPVKAMTHITGGGFQENLPRSMPEGLSAMIDLSSWKPRALFQWIQSEGNIEKQEMLRTFNCGVGMIITLSGEHVNKALEQLESTGENAWIIGQVIDQPESGERVIFSGDIF